VAKQHPMQASTPHAICGAKTRNGGKCKGKPMSNGRCRMHGGGSLAGVASPTFKDGSRSAYMPKNLASIYEQVKDETADLQRNMALNEAFIREKLKTLEDGGDSREIWQKMQKAVNDLKVYMANENYGGVMVMADLIEKLADERERYHRTVTEIQGTLAEQRRDLQAKAGIELSKARAVSAEQFNTFAAAVLIAIKEEIVDRKQREQLANRLTSIISLSDHRKAVS
jgi:hypothetical protein